MQKRTWKKVALTALSVVVLGSVVLAIHIWWVMKPRVDVKTRVMARIDIRQAMGKADADRITTWLYRQKGVDHVLVNAPDGIAIFTYSPLQNNADAITHGFHDELAYSHAIRIVPSQEEMAMGCPVVGASLAYKVYTFVDRLF